MTEPLSLNFDRVAHIYDDTRLVPPVILGEAVECILERTGAHSVFEPGVGTGRIAVEFARRGCEVTGIDISSKMLKVAAQKAAHHELESGIRLVQADARRVPFPDGQFDLLVAVHIFHLISDWQMALTEGIRMVRDGGWIALMRAGRGNRDGSMEERYAAIVGDRCQTIDSPGERSAATIAEWLGGRPHEIRMEMISRDSWRWMRRRTVRDTLSAMRDHETSFTWRVPDEIHRMAMKSLTRDLTLEGKMDDVIESPSHIEIWLGRKLPAGESP